MNIRHIEYITELSRSLNFSAAALKLGISQPTLTQALQKAERDLGAPLFERDGKELRVTPFGKLFLESGAYITELYRETEKRIDDLRHGRTGVLRLEIAPSRAPFTLPRALVRFRELYPGVCVEISERLTANIEKNVAGGLADLGVLVVQGEENPRLDYTPVGTERILLAVPLSLLPASLSGDAASDEAETAPLSAFAGVPFVLLGDDQLIVSQFRAYCEATGFDPEPVARCRNIETSLSLANAGLGAALVTSTGMDYYRTAFPALRYFDAFGGALSRRVCLIRRKNQDLSDPAKALIAFIKEEEF